MYEAERQAMVEMQLMKRGISNKYVLTVMGQIPRHKFVSEVSASLAYGDFAVPIGHGQTISQPYILAKMVELLDPQESDKVLEIGSGSGYSSAVLGHLCRKVISIEREKELADRSKKVFDELKIDNVRVITGDGSVGDMHYYPYDKILISAACPSIPKELVDQLVLGGIIVAPVGERLKQKITKVVKTEKGLFETQYDDVAFVPLKGKRGFTL